MDLFKLSAKLQLDKDDYEDGLNDAESHAKSKGAVISNVLGTLGKATAIGLAASAGTVSVLVKKSVQEYAEYEQTWGGVQKLYGTAGMAIEDYAKSVNKSVDEVRGKYADLEKAQNLVLENAQNSYKTAGMTTQQYMEQATMFSASLINSLEGDTIKAAEQTDVAMKAIADNYNTFGGDISMIQGAFQGFARSNYMMLDNLRLGYAGSKTGMEALIKDANEYAEANGKAANLTIDSFSDIVTAIELIQEKQGIAGTTAREAATTIEGSLNMLKASWQNLVAGFADPNADIGALIDNVVKSLVGSTDEAGQHINGFIDNIMPAVQRAVEGVGKALNGIAPIIAKELPNLLQTVLPLMISTATQLFTELAKALPSLVKVLADQLPSILDGLMNAITQLLPQLGNLGKMIFDMIVDGLSNPTGLDNIVDFAVNIIETLSSGISSNLPKLLETGLKALMSFSGNLRENAGKLVDAGLDMIKSLADGLIAAIPVMVETIPTIISNIANIINDNAPKIIETGIKIIIALVGGIIKAIPVIIANIPKIVKAIVDVILAFQWLNLGKQIIDFFTQGIKGMLKSVVNAAKDIIKSITEKGGLKNLPKMALEWGKDLIDNFVNGIRNSIHKVVDAVKSVAQTVKNFIGFSEPKFGPLSNFHTYAPDMIDLFTQGIYENKGRLIDSVTDAFDFADLITSPVMDYPELNSVSRTINVKSTDSDIYSLLTQIADMLPALGNNQIVLDTGVLVGETASAYDEALGQIMQRKQRSV